MKNHTFHAIGTMVVLALTAIHSFAQSTYEPYTFTTLAGGRGFVSPDRAGRATFFYNPNGVAVDSSGNLYVADTFNHVIQKVSPDGAVTTFAGVSGLPGHVDDTGSAARLNYPIDVTIDNVGNLYVAEGSHTIRKVTPTGAVTTLAGLAGSSGSADGTGSAARFFEPHSLAVDTTGDVFVADYFNSTVRKITPEGVVTTIAGRAGSNGSADGLGSAARFYFPQGIAVDGGGNLFVSNSEVNTIRKVTPVGTNWMVTTIAGLAGTFGSVDGTNSAARFAGPKGCGADGNGNIYVADNDGNTIRKVTPVGTNWVVTTLAGTAGKPGSADGIGRDARFYGPFDVTADSAGNLFVADGGNNLIRKLTLAETNWVVTTVAGLGRNHGSADGASRDALFQLPSSVAVDSSGNIYVAGQGNSSIRKVTSTGVVTTLAGLSGNLGSANGTGPAARFYGPSGLTLDSAGNLYVTDTINSTIRKVTPDGVVTTFAGTAGVDSDGNPLHGYVNATGAAARFYFPTAITIDSATNLYVADSFNGAIRKITSTRVVSSIAGFPNLNADGFPLPGSADGIGTAARFFHPSGIAVDSAGNIYVADTFNHTIRKIDTAAVVSRLAGVAGLAGNVDGIGAVARFNYPSGLAMDSDGNLYIADSANNTIRKMTPGGVVTTLGGLPGITGSADGQGSVARFYYPAGVALDSAGNLYVADYFLSTIRKGYPPPKLFNTRFEAGQFRFDLSAPPGQVVVVETSPDLVSWLSVWTNTGTLNFSDPQSGASSTRFYRAQVR
jgi:sugar lactone lactonase YvrE